MSETFSLWKFGKLKFHTNLTQEGVLIDRIYRIKHTEKFNLNAPHKAPPLLTKLRKIGYSFSKDTELTEKCSDSQTVAVNVAVKLGCLKKVRIWRPHRST